MNALYIHIPFCEKKCLFCSFAVSVGAGHRAGDYAVALGREMKNHAHEKISTVYFGGGTPTFLSEDILRKIVGSIRENFDCDPDAVWSIEANPDGMTPQKAKALVGLGFSRLSLGVQSFDEAHLKFLGRVHSSDDALRAYGVVRDAGFKDVNVDLMYGFPGQTRRMLEADVRALVLLGPQHVSLYTLTIEPNSKFYANAVKLDDEHKLAEDFVFVTNALNSVGIMQYEVSNFAREGFESKHNMAYWLGKPYIGLGMGAHGFNGGRRIWNTSTLTKYLSMVQESGNAIEGWEDLSPEVQLGERLIFGLRMNQGVDCLEIQSSTKAQISDSQHSQIKLLIEEGFLCEEQGRLKATAKGQLVLDEIAVRLI